MLQDSDIDFANILELEVGRNSLPATWAEINTSCAWDSMALVYNHQRWRPASSPGAGVAGCMESGSGPFIIQQFDSVRSTGPGALNSNFDLERLVIIGTRIPHPEVFAESLVSDQTSGLSEALRAVVNATRVDRVVLMADTKEDPSTPSSTLGSYLGMHGSIVSTSLEQTCCFYDGFLGNSTFDRIIANFGSGMETVVLMGDPIPDWAQEIQPGTGVKGGFHKPLRGVLLLGNDRRVAGPSKDGAASTSTPAPAMDVKMPGDNIGETRHGSILRSDMIGDIFIGLMLMFVTSAVVFFGLRLRQHSQRDPSLLAMRETRQARATDVEVGARRVDGTAV